MNDALKQLDALALRARRETAPRVHVTGQVLARLASTPRRVIDREMGVLALASAATACIAITFALWNHAAPPDPIETMIEVSALLGL